jgi:transcriptional regulator with AAA-type ATPase domain
MSKTAEDNSQNSAITLEESRNLLYQYCLAGNIKEVRNTIEKYKLDLDLDLEFTEALVYTIRGTGTQKEKENILLYLDSLGVSLSIREKLALKWAIRTHDLELVKFLQGQGVDIIHDVEMHIFDAALKKDTTILKYLLDEGAKISREFLEDVSSLDGPLPEGVMEIIGMFPVEN